MGLFSLIRRLADARPVAAGTRARPPAQRPPSANLDDSTPWPTRRVRWQPLAPPTDYR
jgi:hypothetical protein